MYHPVEFEAASLFIIIIIIQINLLKLYLIWYKHIFYLTWSATDACLVCKCAGLGSRIIAGPVVTCRYCCSHDDDNDGQVLLSWTTWCLAKWKYPQSSIFQCFVTLDLISGLIMFHIWTKLRISRRQLPSSFLLCSTELFRRNISVWFIWSWLFNRDGLRR